MVNIPLKTPTPPSNPHKERRDKVPAGNVPIVK